jgi:hypothetical protein
MTRQWALKAVLVIIGLLFTAGVYPIVDSIWHANQSLYSDDMMLSLYVVLGVLLLRAVRDPSEHRSLLAFAAWSSVAHAAVMAAEAWRTPSERPLLWGSAVLVVIAVALIALAPASKAGQRASPALA